MDDREGSNDAADDVRPLKKRKISDNGTNQADSITVKTEADNSNAAVEDEPCLPQHVDLPKLTESTTITTRTTTTTQIVVETSFSTPRSKVANLSSMDLNTSPLSSPPAEEFIIPPSTFRSHTHRRLTDVAFPLSSSPLSSPPPVLFDPFEPCSPSDRSSDRRSSTSPSEVDETDPIPNPFASSQGSVGGKNMLPNMKGKDLFDANIWSDPIRTSVFYTFATSLRQKIKDAEPTTSHRFISHLRDRGKLVRCYTQNIDQIEEKVGLSTCLQDGPGSRGRFSRRSTANTNQLNKMVEEANSVFVDKLPSENSSQSETSIESSQQSQASTSASAPEEKATPSAEGDTQTTDQAKLIPKVHKKELPRSGVECVFLHGSLDLLRCFLCGKVCSWDDDARESETLSGQQPECPHCVGATVAREERGKRALGVGKLRPDIVLYGEEHPNSHLISPIVTHDLGLYPDMLLILGTSLRVHGLKVMVREFAKAVHSKGGKVVFVNFTKPPDSIWGDIIDYWVQWDCDAWVTDLQSRVPKLWQEPEPPKPRKKRESSGASEDSAKEEKKKPPAANPVALRDTKVTGAYWTSKVLNELHRITGTSQTDTAPARRASISAAMTMDGKSMEVLLDNSTHDSPKVTKPKPKRPRRSAPGALEKAQRRSSTLNPNHGRSRKNGPAPLNHTARPPPEPTTPQTRVSTEPNITSSILSSVKENARVRKRKMIDGEEIPSPVVGRRRGAGSAQNVKNDDLKLPPLQTPSASQPMPLYGKLQPLEPKSPPSGPLTSLSPNLRSAKTFGRGNVFHLQDALVTLLNSPPQLRPLHQRNENMYPFKSGTKEEANAAVALARLRTSPIMTRSRPQKLIEGNLKGELENWGSNWRQ